jgi:ubiquitin C-terminal hydrolase
LDIENSDGFDGASRATSITIDGSDIECGGLRVSSLLARYFGREEGVVMACERCGRKDASAEVSRGLLAAPEVLVLHMKRFYFDRL